MKYYKEFRITLYPFDSELLSAFFWDFDIKGLLEEDNTIIIYADDDTNLTVENITSYLDELKFNKIIQDFAVEEKFLKEKNWNEDWEKKRKIIRVTDKIVIKPSFMKYKKKKDEIVLTIDPKMSFGTGEHASTKLMLRLIEKYISKNDKVLDIGGGTGILSIASAKLGASKIVAVDNDEWSYKNCTENCKVNGVRDNVKIRFGEVSAVKEKNFDLVLANIQKNILLELAPQIGEKVKKEGVVLLSGLLIKDKNDVIKEYRKLGLEFLKSLRDKEWIALSLTKFMS
jgi:ribosomal protein L11 methyltransferase